MGGGLPPIWFIDGLPEILFGLALLILATLAFTWRIYAPKRWIDLDWLIVWVGFPLYYVNERRVLDFLKSRLTYPRTGYVQPPVEFEWKVPVLTALNLEPAPPTSENLTFFRMRTVYPAWLVYVFLFLASGAPMERWLAALAMPALAVTLYAASRSSERPYRWWSVLFLALTGAVLLLPDIPVRGLRPLPILFAGVWLVAQGTCTLVHYLRANPHTPTAEGVQA